MFNIKITQNFNSPLKSRNIVEFWTRWHITLSQFITTYVFTPIVRSVLKLNFRNMLIGSFLAMLISGVWHGAGWTFIIYGGMHGLAIVLNHLMKKRKKKLPLLLACFLSFNFINISFTMFRANTVSEALNIYAGMFGFNGIVFPKGIVSKDLITKMGVGITHHMTNSENLNLLLIIVMLFVVFKARNSMEMMKKFEPNGKTAFYTASIFVLCLFGMNRITEFIYFNF